MSPPPVCPCPLQVGVGSSFTVWLPISQDGAVMSADESEAREQYAL
jgi:hypothetical protein